MLLTRVLLHATILYAVTFGLILPFLCLDLPYSLYFRNNWLEDKPLADFVNSAINRRAAPVLRAEKYFSSLPPLSESDRDNSLQKRGSPRFAIGIITTRRVGSFRYPGYDPKYLTEVAARAHEILQRRPDNDSVLVICNVDRQPDEHGEADRLSKCIPSIAKYMRANDHENNEEQLTMEGIYKTEQEDYSFCLDKLSKLKPSYTVLLQDDALMQWDFFDVLERILKTRIENTLRRGELLQSRDSNNVAAVKLYFPEKWQGYSWEPSRLAELSLIGWCGGMLLAAAYSGCNPRVKSSFPLRCLVVLLSVSYFQLIAVTVGRHYLLEIRRLLPGFYTLSNAPDCCIPAVVYNNLHVARIVGFLESIECSRAYPVDIAISDFIRRAGLEQYLVVPSLVRHIGMFSTLHREPKDPLGFLDV